MKYVFITFIGFLLFTTSCKDEAVTTTEKKTIVNEKDSEAQPVMLSNYEDVHNAFVAAQSKINKKIAGIYEQMLTASGTKKNELQRRKMKLEQISKKIEMKMATLEADSEKGLNRFLDKSNQWLTDLNERINI
jgi:membrane-bound lytic murein transglycosylase